jgi:hypothetical protein
LADEIVEPAASRVFRGSPFGYGHEPEGLAAFGLVSVVGAVPELAQAATATPTAMIRPASLIFLVPIASSSSGSPTRAGNSLSDQIAIRESMLEP